MKQLVYKMYRDVFPSYFTLEEIERIERIGILALQGLDTHTGTLKGAFQVMACLQILILILEGRKISGMAAE